MHPTRTATFLHNNWPLLTAGLLIVLGGVYFLASLPFDIYSDENPLVIYPLITFSSSTVLILFLASFVALLVLPAYTAYKKISQDLYIGLVLCAMGIALFMSIAWKAPIVIILIAATAILFAGLISSKRVRDHYGGRTYIQAICIFLLANIVSCSSCARFTFDRLEHRQSVTLDGMTYNLAIYTSEDFDYCADRHAAIYKCDRLGLFCRQVHKAFYECSSLEESQLKNLKFFVENNRLYLRLDDRTELIAP